MHAHLAFSALALSAGLATGAIYIEVDAMSAGPDGSDTFGAVIGQSDTLGVWIWSDEPEVDTYSISFDLVGTVYGSTQAYAGWFTFQSLGTPDPTNAYALDSSPGELTDADARISGVTMIALPLDQFLVELPTDEPLALYTGFSGTPFAFTGGAIAMNIEVLSTAGPVTDIVTYGWYQVPAPGMAGVMAGASVIATRRHRCKPRA
jgi:hypothetical protein